ncbi:hypothetical protein, partial [Stenotrophomonas sp.]|uniref:hypothetical protein n=1 Tax=Stenotrophomonas sp. TaxID=69392 RepID=UPI0028AAF2F2
PSAPDSKPAHYSSRGDVAPSVPKKELVLPSSRFGDRSIPILRIKCLPRLKVLINTHIIERLLLPLQLPVPTKKITHLEYPRST